MTETEKKIAEIREALEKATPGPWNFAVFEDSRHVIFDNTFLSRHIAEIVRGGVESEQREKDNAHLIANAPEWLRFLLSELDRLKREIESHGPEGRNYTNQQVVELRLELEQAREENRERFVQIAELVPERERLIEGNRKLREERDAYYNNARYTEAAFHEVTSLRSQLQSAQQEIERLGNLARQERELADHWMRKHHDDVVKLRQERNKLIDGLQWYGDQQNYKYPSIGGVGAKRPIDYDRGQRARNILREIGVTDV